MREGKDLQTWLESLPLRYLRQRKVFKKPQAFPLPPPQGVLNYLIPGNEGEELNRVPPLLPGTFTIPNATQARV